MIGQVKKISEVDKENLKKKTITMEEVSKTLKNTRNNVAPGLGGLTGAFYKVFLCFLKKIVLGAMHEIFINKELLLTIRQGIIALIPKGYKDRRYIYIWQPLTLLDTLYKFFSSTLASRLKATLDRILGNEQKAYVPGHFISECTRNNYDIFSHTKENNLPGIILLIDVEKDFNSVSFEFIITTLEFFYFGENFKTWITILLGMEKGKSFNAVTVINGNISTPFEIQRGCRQRDPLSGHLFILAIEILALMITNDKIKPYTTKNCVSHLFNIYAYDLTIYLQR